MVADKMCFILDFLTCLQNLGLPGKKSRFKKVFEPVRKFLEHTNAYSNCLVWGFLTVLQIRDFYPGPRIFPSRIADRGVKKHWTPDPDLQHWFLINRGFIPD
jgi:hypothetical protein